MTARAVPLALLALAAAGCCPTLGPSVSAVTLRPQETANWCWAASTEMVVATVGQDVRQCELANQRFGRTDCCSGTCPQNAACNMPGWTMFTELGYAHTDSATPLPFATIKDQICRKKKPMSYAYGPQSGGVGHVVVIYGYLESGADQWVMIRDPWAPCQGNTYLRRYSDYAASTTTNHWQTSYDVTRGP